MHEPRFRRAARRPHGSGALAWIHDVVHDHRHALLLYLAGIVTVALVVGSHLQYQELVAARRDLTTARTQLQQVEAARSVSALELAFDRQKLRASEQKTQAAVDAIAVEQGTTAGLEASLGEERTVLATAQRDLDTAAGRLAWLQDVLSLQGGAIEELGACVSGLDAANDALAAGNQDGAVAALVAATAACAAVRDAGGSSSFPFDFPDPHVVHGQGAYWAFATNSTAGAVQVISSPDLQQWTVRGDAISGLPAWAQPGATWAPAAVTHGGKWLLFYTVREKSSGKQCITVAVGDAPGGKYADTSKGPLVCERDQGGSIDPNPVVDASGALHLLWKTELDTVGGRAELRGARLRADGLAVEGAVRTLLTAGASWEGRTIEAPTMVVSPAGYQLLYSGSSWNSSRYGVGSAVCDSVLGPCRRVAERPVLTSSGSVTGPGGLSVFVDSGGRVRSAYHAWSGRDVGYPHSRYLHIGSLRTDGYARPG